MRFLLPLLILLPAPLAAATFERPVPQAQTEVVEIWFALASVGFILTLAAVQWLVQRR